MNWRPLVPDQSVFSQYAMLIPYKGIISTAFVCKLIFNTGYNYSGLRLQIFWNNEILIPRQAKDYDTGRDWRNTYVEIIATGDDDPIGVPIPADVNTRYVSASQPDSVRYRQLTTDYTYFIRIPTSIMTSTLLQMTALASGGVRIYNPDVVNTFHFTGCMTMLRTITGAAV